MRREQRVRLLDVENDDLKSWSLRFRFTPFALCVCGKGIFGCLQVAVDEVLNLVERTKTGPKNAQQPFCVPH
jgi:hypothetical protein